MSSLKRTLVGEFRNDYKLKSLQVVNNFVKMKLCRCQSYLRLLHVLVILYAAPTVVESGEFPNKCNEVLVCEYMSM